MSYSETVKKYNEYLLLLAPEYQYHVIADSIWQSIILANEVWNLNFQFQLVVHKYNLQ